MVKKAALVGFVILTFIIYSFHQRNEGTQALSQVTANTPKTSQPDTSQTTISPSDIPSTSSGSSSAPTASGQYKDGTYTGKSSDAYYGFVQVRATISDGKLTSIDFLDYPQDRENSIEINDYAMPQLKRQAIQTQSAQVDGVSGATDTTQAFTESLGDALSQARS